jgi:hypothetical protein
VTLLVLLFNKNVKGYSTGPCGTPAEILQISEEDLYEF